MVRARNEYKSVNYSPSIEILASEDESRLSGDQVIPLVEFY